MMDSAFHRFLLGDFECCALLDDSFNYPLNTFFANAPEAQIADTLRQHGLPLEHITTPYTCLFVDTGQHRVMIDTGAGQIGAMAAKVFPNVDHSTTVTGQLPQSLRAAAIEIEGIDVVIITHAHPDHIGGTLDDAGKLIFGNARYFIARDEWQFWTSDAADAKAPLSMVQMVRQNLEPIKERITLIDDGYEVVPGITVMATPGHTPGHLAVSIISGTDRLLHISDVVLHPLHLEHTNWMPFFDIDPEQAGQSKQRTFDRAAEEQALVFAHHFPPFPNLGRIFKKEQGWQWKPIDPR